MHYLFLALVALLTPLAAFAQDVAADPMLAMLGDIDLRLCAALAIIAGAMRTLPINATFAIAFPTAGGILFGALRAFYASPGATPYDIALAAVLTGAGATIVGRTAAAALEAKKPGN